MELHSIEEIAKVLNAEKIRYIVVGGLAVNAHGYQRFTNDIDLVISLEPDNIRRALYALISIGYNPSVPISPEDFAVAENRATWHEEKSMLVLKLWSDSHRRTPINVFIREPFDFDAEWEKVIYTAMGDVAKIPILSYNALIRMKEEAGREKDLLDISALRKLDPYRS
ncbi:MAG: hypothetical protein H7Y36_03795 [Armatimonadetes bacterium]|nr:hypothetical protein [Akkermansiaceae bacterium]